MNDRSGSQHPSVAACRSAVRRSLADLDAGDVVVVAVSGGADSLALTDAVVASAAEHGLRVLGATVDHALQEGSAAQAARVVEQMAALGVDETVTARVQVHTDGHGVEAAARQARYAVLEEIAERSGAPAVLLGHTRDDQAETVLLGLTRGSGGRSLAGMRRGFDRMRRPLLDVTRAQTEEACDQLGLTVWHDPFNDDPRFTRSRVRTEVLPMLERELGPGVAATLARTADQLRIDMDYLDDLAEQAWVAAQELSEALSVENLAAMPVAIRRRVLRLAALAAGAPASELFYPHVLAVEELITDWRGQKWIDLPGPVRAVRRDGRLCFQRQEADRERRA